MEDLVFNKAEAATSLQSIISGINFATPSWDIFIILFFLVAAFLYGLSLGRDRIIVILVSLYMALAVVNNVPYLQNFASNIGVGQFFVVKISTFIGIFVILFFLLSRSALLATIVKSEIHGPWWQVMIFSLLHIGLIISIVLSFLPQEVLANLAPMTKSIFTSDLGKFIWIVAPIVAMILSRETDDERRKYKYDDYK